jgi:hypothetical protein
MIIPPDETTARKWKLFKLMVYVCLESPPEHLIADSKEEVDALLAYKSDDWADMNWDGMGLRFGQGEVYKWVKTQATQVWAGEYNEWYEKEVKPWLERHGESW